MTGQRAPLAASGRAAAGGAGTALAPRLRERARRWYGGSGSGHGAGTALARRWHSGSGSGHGAHCLSQPGRLQEASWRGNISKEPVEQCG